MRGEEIYDTKMEFILNKKQIFNIQKPLFTNTFAIRQKDKSKMNAYVLNEYSSSKTSIWEIYNSVILHKEPESTCSRFAIIILTKFAFYLAVVCQVEKEEIQEILFGKKHQKLGNVLKQSIKILRGNFDRDQIIAYFHNHKEDEDRTTEKDEVNQQQEIKKFNDKAIEKLFDIIGTKSDSSFKKSHLDNYKLGIDKLMRAFIPKIWGGQQFMMKKILKQLSPIYELSLIQTKPIQKEQSEVLIVSCPYENYEYQIRKKLRSKQGKIPSQNVLNLADLVFYLKYQCPEDQKVALKQQLCTSFTKDIICELIMFYSLTKRSYPSLTPMNIFYNTASKSFFLSLEPVLLTALGFESSDYICFKKFMLESAKVLNFHWFFTENGKKPGVQTFITNRAYLKYEFIQSYFNLMNSTINENIRNNYLQQYLVEFEISEGIDLKGCTLFNLNAIFQCDAKGIDMSYKDHCLSWLKSQICKYLKTEKIMKQEYEEYLNCLKMLYSLKVFLESPKKKIKKAALSTAQKISKTQKWGKISKTQKWGSKDQYSDKLEATVRKLGKKMEDFRIYIKRMKKILQSPIEITKIYVIDFYEIEKELISLMPAAANIESQILWEILKNYNQKSVDLFFEIFKSVKKYREKSQNCPTQKQLQNFFKIIQQIEQISDQTL